MSLTPVSPSGSLSGSALLEEDARIPPWPSVGTAVGELDQVGTAEVSEEALQYLQSEGEFGVCLEYVDSSHSDSSVCAPAKSAVAEADFEKLMFEDHLVTVSDTGTELGVFTVTVEASKLEGEPCFLVHANSHGTVEGVPCGTSIVCHVSKSLETLEQQHHEFVKLEYAPLDRKTVITKQQNGYVVNRVVARGEDVKSTTNSFSLDVMKGFISEGSNLLLHRIFISKGLPEELQFISLDSEDNICPSVYRPLAERTQKVDEVDLKVFGVERSIDSRVDLPITWQAYYTKNGHLTNRVQIGSPVIMTLQHLPGKEDEYTRPPKPEFEKKDLDWEEDMQMFSRFLDRKEELKNSHMVFLRHHPELKALLADFLQFLLLDKPVDILAFSANYFASFSTTMVSEPRYIAPTLPPRFPYSCTNAEIEALRAVRLDEK